ncbi:MAG: hypothetical protein AABX51_00700, partial [Nanoarchaeota archaeon]
MDKRGFLIVSILVLFFNVTFVSATSCVTDSDCGDSNSWKCKGGQCSEITLNCGDGIIQSGEQCESTLNCPSGKICDSCQCIEPTINYNCEKILDNG